MSRYTGPTTRINRRFGLALFPANKAFERKRYLPGIHGSRLRRRETSYSIGLNEKQKVRYLFGLTEKQFHLFFERAKRKKGVTGEILLQSLELRLDNVVYLLGFSRTRRSSRQLVTHGHIKVNGNKLDIPSYVCQIGDEISVKDHPTSRRLATRGLEESQGRVVPHWLQALPLDFKGTVSRLPAREESHPDIKEQLIVEFYSR